MLRQWAGLVAVAAAAAEIRWRTSGVVCLDSRLRRATRSSIASWDPLPARRVRAQADRAVSGRGVCLQRSLWRPRRGATMLPSCAPARRLSTGVHPASRHVRPVRSLDIWPPHRRLLHPDVRTTGRNRGPTPGVPLAPYLPLVSHGAMYHRPGPAVRDQSADAGYDRPDRHRTSHRRRRGIARIDARRPSIESDSRSLRWGQIGLQGHSVDTLSGW